MFSDRIFPPVSGGKSGRGNVSRIFIAIVLTAARKQAQLRQTTNLSGVKDRSFVPNHLGFKQAVVTVQEYAVPKRSEEHTSELQSLAYLVCRLLLEKKKTREAGAIKILMVK